MGFSLELGARYPSEEIDSEKSSQPIPSLLCQPQQGGEPVIGKDPATKLDDFLEKLQTAFDPPPQFWKIILQIFNNNWL